MAGGPLIFSCAMTTSIAFLRGKGTEVGREGTDLRVRLLEYICARLVYRDSCCHFLYLIKKTAFANSASRRLWSSLMKKTGVEIGVQIDTLTARRAN